MAIRHREYGITPPLVLSKKKLLLGAVPGNRLAVRNQHTLMEWGCATSLREREREREKRKKEKSGSGPCSTFNGVKLGSEEERWLDCGYKTMKTLKLGGGGFTLKV